MMNLFKKLAHQGVVLGSDGLRMSKSRGNVVNPDDVRKKYGSDAVRLYVCFMGPFDKDKPWDTNGIEGVRRFLDRIWRLAIDESGQVITSKEAPTEDINKLLHKSIKKVTEDIETLSFNTAVSAMMILVNELYKQNCHSHSVLKTLTQLLMPMAPHFSEELWSKLGGENFASLAPWPTYDQTLVAEDEKEFGVQVNGKMRGSIQLNIKAPESEALTEAKKNKFCCESPW